MLKMLKYTHLHNVLFLLTHFVIGSVMLFLYYKYETYNIQTVPRDVLLFIGLITFISSILICYWMITNQKRLNQIVRNIIELHIKQKVPCEINIKDDDVLEVLIASTSETSFVFKLKNEYYAINHNGCIRIEKKIARDINTKGNVDDATQKLIEERNAK